MTIGRIDLSVGSRGHDDVGADNISALLLSSVNDITIGSYRFGVTDGTGAVTGFQGAYINKCDEVDLERLINRSASGLARYLLKVRASNNVKVSGHKLTAGAAVGPAYITGSTDFDLDDGEILNIPSGQTGLTISSVDAALGTTARVTRTSFAGAGGSGIGMTASSASMQRVLLDGNDYNGVALPISTNPSGRLGQSTTATASALKTDTTLQVASSAVFMAGDLVLATAPASG